MPKFNVSKSIHIAAPPEKVFPALNDLHHWVEWSPWLIMEKNTTLNIAEDGKSYDWKGPRTGSGNMQILNEDKNRKVSYDLNFLKPWKSHAKVDFLVKDEGDSSVVTWNMDSQLPWFMFWMKKNMVAFIGNDYERGLMMLKDYVEEGKVQSKLNFIGEGEFQAKKFIGVETTCSLKESANQMQKDIERLQPYGDMSNIFVQYHKWDFVTEVVRYTAGIFTDDIPSDLDSGLISGEIPSTKIYTLEHIGPYHHLGNAWSTLYNMQRNKEIKIRKDVYPFETYMNDPATTEPTELITHIHFPLKD